MKRVLLLLTVFLAMIWSVDVHATHLMGADLTYTIVGPHQYTVRLSVYRDCNSAVVQPTSFRIYYSSVTCNDTGSFLVNVASGYPVNVSDTCATQHSTCDGGTVYGVQQWVYTSAVISLPANCPDVIMSWASGNRNAVINNLNNPLNDAMYINAEVNTSLIDNSPQFLNPLTVNLCLNQLNYINQGGYDANGDSLVYALDYAQGTTGVGGGPAGYPYVPVNLTYNAGYTPTDPITSSTFNFDPSTGQITVFPTQSEYDVVKLIVYEYRNGVLIGHVERDMQVEVANCTDTLPNVSGVGGLGTNDSIYTLSACSRGCFTLYSYASDTNKILTLTVTGQSAFPGATFTISSGKNPTLTFCWDPTRANAGTYTFFVTVKDNACPQPGQNVRSYRVIIPQVYPAGADQTICQYNTVHAQATGTGTWSIVPGNPAVTTIANTTLPTTLITGFTSPGRYNYQWITDTTCVDTMAILVTSKPNAGPDQTVCQFNTATMAATGTGTWTALATNPNTTTITTPTLATTTISGFTTVGTYTYIWSSAGCTDTANVIVTLKPNAGPDQTMCINTGTVTMAAIGTGTWTAAVANPSTTVITTPTSPTTTITGLLTAGTYTYYWTNGCADTVNIFVTSRPNGGPDQATCQYSSVTMAGTGTGTWSAQAGNPGASTIVTPTSPTTEISGFTAAGTYYYIWTGGVGCADTAAVVVTAKPNAGPDQNTCLNTTITMAATGTGTWTSSAANPATATITNTTSPTTTVTGLTVAGTYAFYWTANGCADTVQIIVNPTPNAGPDQTICQYVSTVMAAVGTGTWTTSASNPAVVSIVTPASPTTTVNGFSQPGVYILIWSSLGCSDTVLINVTAKPNAGPDQTICQYTTATMAGTGTGTWTAFATNPAVTVITSPTSPITTITGFTLAGTYSYVWTSNGCTDTANVIVTAKPNAGPDQTICQYSIATMAATGTGTWMAFGTNPAITTITTITSPTSAISGFTVAGTYSYVWTSNGCTDTANVIVTAKPNAGPDQTICQYSTTTLAATGTGTWTTSAANPAFVTFTNATSPTTSVSGFTSSGTYTLYWSLNGCSDTVLIHVTSKPNAGADQTICQYFTAVMAGTGAGTWSADAGNPAVVNFVSTTSPTTSVSGFAASGTYTLYWSQNGCSDTVLINVTAKPNAGPDQTICQNSTTTLSATGAGAWTAAAANPAIVTFTNATSPTTSVSGFTAVGTYALYWSLNGCSDTILITVTGQPNAGPDQTICQYTTATMSAAGTGTWTAIATNPATTIISSPTSPTTTITGFTAAGTYGYIWSLNGCVDTANVIVTAKPNAGADQSFCLPGTATITATGGPGMWTAMTGNPGASTIVSPNSASSIVNDITVGGYYSYIWTVNGCTDTAVVTAFPTSPAGSDQTICQYNSVTTAAFGNGTWLPLSNNPATTTIANTTADTTTINGFSVAGLYGFIWSVSPCTDTLFVTVNAKPDAGPDQSTCQYSTATMAATGTGAWTAIATNPAVTTIATVTSPTTTISGLTVAGTYSYVWTSNGCTDTANVIVTVKPNAGPDQSTCQYSTATMAATGTGTWTALISNPATTTITTTTSPTTEISGFTVAGAYSYVWTSNGCTDTANVIVTVKPNAGPDETTCQFSTATMAATGTGTWTLQPGNPAVTVIITPASPTTSISGFSVAGTYGYIWTANGCSDTANVIVTAKPNAGADQTTCQYSTATMAATATGTWTAIATNPVVTLITTATSPTTTISGFTVAGTYGYIWTSNGCGDTANVIVTAKPNAGPDQSTCQFSTATMAATGAGTWTIEPGNPAVTVITTTTSPTTTISGFSVAGTYSYIWTSNGCSDTADVIVTVKPNAGPDQTTCQFSTATMAATGTGTWTAIATNPAVTVITTAASPTTSISGFTLAGTYGYIWTSNGCSDTANVIVTAKPNAGADQTICQYSSTVMAATGTGTWTADAGDPSVVTFASATSPTTSVSGFSASGTYTLYWSHNGCSDTVLINVTAKPNAGSDQTICLYSTTILAATGTGAWTAAAANPAVVTFTNASSPTTSVSGFTASGTYTLYWSLNGCSDTMLINVTAKPNAGPDQTTCQYSTATMAATGTGTWTAMGGNPATTVITTITSPTTTISGFVIAGTYSYIWTSNGCSDTANVNVTAKPDAGADQSFCLPGSATITATPGPGSWTALSTNPVSTIVSPNSTSTVVNIVTGGFYSYIWTANGCTDTTTVTAYPTSPAGADQTICQYNSIVTAAFGNGTWIPLSTNPNPTAIANTTADTTSITGFNVAGSYGFIWSVSPCTDTLFVTVVAKPNAGPDQTFCQYSTTVLAATGTGTWTSAAADPAVLTFVDPTSPTTAVSGFTVAGTYTLYWSMNGCSDTMLIHVTAKPNAGADQTICQYSSTTMTGTGTGSWTADAGNPAAVTFVNTTSPTTAVNGFTASGTYTLYWSLNGCSDTVLINVTAKPDAGPDQTFCQYSTTVLAATGTGAWTTAASDPAVLTFVDATSPTTAVSGFTVAGTYTLYWSMNGCSDTMLIHVTAKPNAGNDQTICQYSSTAMTGTGTGTWTADAGNPAVVTFVNATSPTTVVNGFTVSGTYTLYWSLNGCSDTVLINVTAKPNAGPDQTFCQYSTTVLSATGTGTWTTAASDPAVLTFVDPTSPTTAVSGFTVAGTYTLYWSMNGCSDTMLIHVTAKPSAGNDQTICQYSSTSMTGTGTGTWTADAGNPAVVTFVNATSPTSAVNGFTASGVYTLYWSLNGCSDTVLINVTAKPNAGADQTLCLPGTITTAASAGAGLWTALASNPAASTIASPNNPVTVISGFTTGGIYSYVWTVNGCSDTMNVNIIPLSPAGPDQTTCEYTTITTAAFGNGTWTTLSNNPAPTTITNASSGITTINGFNAAGTYAYVWLVNGCSDTMLVTVVAKPDAGTDQTICQYSTTTMTATGTGTWTVAASNPALINFVSTTDPVTTVSGFTSSGVYTLYWSLNGCSDTVLINVTAKPNAGSDQTICQYSTTAMAATGTGTWTADAGNPAVVTFANSTSPTTSVNGFTLSGTYTFYWTLNGCSDTVLINVTAKPDAGPDQTFCQYSSTVLAATGTGTWTTAASDPAVLTFANSTLPTSGVSGFTASGTYTLYWSLNGCSDTMLINVTAKPDAGPDQTICQYSTTAMAATGTGTWTADAGNPAIVTFVSTASPTTSVNGFTLSGTYTFYWTLNGCSDTVLINVTAKPDAGPDQTFCQYSSTVLAAIGTGTWTTAASNPVVLTFVDPTSPTTAVSGFTAAGTYTIYWSLNGCSDTMLINVTAKPDAGPDQTICQYSTTAMAATGTGTWTADAGNPAVVTFVSATSPTTSVNGFTLSGTYTFYWTLNGCSDTVLINVTAKPDAGPDQTFCQYSSTVLAATGTGTWTTAASNPVVLTFVDPISPTTAVSGFTAAGTYTIYWSLNGCSDTMLINVTAKPDAGPDQTICQYSTTAMAATGTGTWTADAGNPAVVTFVSATSPTTSVNGFTLSGTYTFYWTLNGCSDTMLINVTAKPDAGPDQTFCQYSSTVLAATGTGTWTTAASNPAPLTFVNATSPTSGVSGFTSSGVYILYWSLNGCNDTMLIDVTAKPNAGTDQTICQYSNTAMAATGTGAWTADAGNPAVITFVNTSDPATSVSGFGTSGTYTFYWTLNGCSDTVLINVTAKPDAGPDQNVCQYTTVTMAAVGTGAWTSLSSNPSVATITSPTGATTTITALSSVGTYGFVWTVNGCTDTINVVVNTQPTITLRDTAICLNKNATLIPTVTPAGGTYLWSTTEATATITVAPTVSTGFTVTYTLGICSATAADTVTVDPLPMATVATIASVCTANNGIAIANPSAGTPGYTYSWSAPGGSGDSLTGLAPGPYQVTVTDINHCTTTASGTVALQNPNITVTEVSQHDLKCFNDSSGAITINAADTARTSSGYILTYDWSNNTFNQNLSNLHAGVYTVTVSDQYGCSGTGSYTITQPAAITGITTFANPQCHAYTNGSAGIGSLSGGSGGYHFAWSTNPVQTTQTITGLPAGSYTVSVTDDSLCLVTYTVTLTDPLAITFGNSVITNPTCAGDSNGTALVVPQNGIGNYTYAWSNGQNTNPATGLYPGTFGVQVTDANGCTAQTSVTLTPLTQLDVTLAPTNVLCNGTSTGSITANTTGGTAPYNYLWNNHAVTATIINLSVGTYSVVATDNNGCSASNSATLTQPSKLHENLSAVRTNCPNQADGTIYDTATGGTGSITFTLEDTAGNILQSGNTTGTFTGLGYGPYIVVATDQNNCPVSEEVIVPRAPFNVYADTVVGTSCYGSQYQDGILHLQGYTIPNGPFQYSVDNGPFQFISDFFNLSAGAHTVTAQDNYGCDTTFNILVPQPLPATLQILPGDSTITAGTTLQLSTDFGPFNVDSIKGYNWSPVTGLSCVDCSLPIASPFANQTTYTLTVTYNQGCLVTATIQINVNGKPPVYIPNGFTPNGDGTNDVWQVFGTGIKDIKATIFNRWGEKMFESDNQSQGWDGTYRGQPQPPGVYVYLVEIVYLSDEKDTRQGSLTLIR